MVSTLLFLTFLSMAVGAPLEGGFRTNDLSQWRPVGPAGPAQLSVKDEGEDEMMYSGGKKANLKQKAPIVRTAEPPQEDLLGYYIFTTYHLLLKDIRNVVGDTEIVAHRNSGSQNTDQTGGDNTGDNTGGSTIERLFQL